MSDLAKTLGALKGQIRAIENRVSGGGFEGEEAVASLASALPTAATAVRDAVFAAIESADGFAGLDVEDDEAE